MNELNIYDGVNKFTDKYLKKVILDSMSIAEMIRLVENKPDISIKIYAKQRLVRWPAMAQFINKLYNQNIDSLYDLICFMNKAEIVSQVRIRRMYSEQVDDHIIKIYP